MQRLQGKVALITGGNSGIGRGIANRLAEEGATGFIVGRDEETLAATEAELGSGFSALRADVTRVDELEATFARAEAARGPLDVLVVNAGGAVGEGSLQPLTDIDEESFAAMTDLNFRSVLFTVQKALPHLKDGASVVLVASIAVHKGFPGMCVYGACKAAVRSLARTMSMELLPRRIRVNVLSPGTIDTPVFARLGFSDDEAEAMRQQFADLIPLKRTGTPSEMGAVAAFLASDDSSFVVGEEIIADGGVVNL